MKKHLLLIFCFTVFWFLIDNAPLKAQNVQPGPKIAAKNQFVDLVVSNVQITPESPRAQKDLITVKVLVKNAGNKAPSKNCSLSMSVWSVDPNDQILENGDRIPNAFPRDTDNIPSLDPGATHLITKTMTVRHAGRHRIEGAIITEGLAVGEEKNQNNSYKAYFTAALPPLPADLVLQGIKLTHDGRIQLEIYNGGSAIPDMDFNRSYVKVRAGDNQEKNIFLRDMDPTGLLKNGEPAPLGGFSRVYVNYLWPLTGPNAIKLEPKQTYSVQVILDYNAGILDANRNNNSKTTSLQYVP